MGSAGQYTGMGRKNVAYTLHPALHSSPWRSHLAHWYISHRSSRSACTTQGRNSTIKGRQQPPGAYWQHLSICNNGEDMSHTYFASSLRSISLMTPSRLSARFSSFVEFGKLYVYDPKPLLKAIRVAAASWRISASCSIISIPSSDKRPVLGLDIGG